MKKLLDQLDRIEQKLDELPEKVEKLITKHLAKTIPEKKTTTRRKTTK